MSGMSRLNLAIIYRQCTRLNTSYDFAKLFLDTQLYCQDDIYIYIYEQVENAHESGGMY